MLLKGKIAIIYGAGGANHGLRPARKRGPCERPPVSKASWTALTPRPRSSSAATFEVSDLNAALSWAARCPGAQDGAIEVRPVWA